MIYNIKIAPHLNPSKLPTTFDAFKGGKKSIKIAQSTIDFYSKAVQEFNDLQKNGKSKITSRDRGEN